MNGSTPRMARTLQPEVFFDEALFALEQSTQLPVRVVYLALHTVCDRLGRFCWNARTLRFFLLDDQDVIQRSLKALQREGKVVQYRVDGTEYGFLPGFTETQHINPRERASVIPSHTDGEIIFFDGTTAPGRRGAGRPSSKSPFLKTEEVTRGTPVAAPVVAEEVPPVAAAPVQTDLIPLEEAPAGLPVLRKIVPDIELGPVMAGGFKFYKVKNCGILREGGEARCPVIVTGIDDFSENVTEMMLVGKIRLLGISRNKVKEYDDLYPMGDNVVRVRKAAQWLKDREAERKTAAGVMRFLNGWINRAQNNGEDLIRPASGGMPTSFNRSSVFGGRLNADEKVADTAARTAELIRGGTRTVTPSEFEVH